MSKLLKFLYPFLKGNYKYAIGSLLFSFVLAAIKGAQAYLVKPIFDNGLGPNSTVETAAFYAAVLLGSAFLNFPIRFLHFYWIRYVVDEATCQLREKIYQKFQKLPLGYFTSNKQGTLVSNILNDAILTSQGFRSMIDLIREPLTAIIMLGLALYHDWQLTLVVLIVTPLFVVIFNLSGKKVRHSQGEVQEQMAMMTHNVGEGLSGQKVIKAFNLQNFALKRFAQSQNSYFKYLMKTTKIEELAHPLVELIGAIAFSGTILFAHYRIQSGELSTGEFLGFITALALLMDPIRKFSQANVKLNMARAAAERIFGLLEVQEERSEGKINSFEFKEDIVFKNVSFSYGDHKVLKDFSLRIKKGEKVALVGLSGSGKTTLIHLLLRLYEIQEGEILIDGVNINEFSLEALRNLFGLVSQDVFLFNDTVTNNLVLDNNYTQRDIDKALDVAHASEFVSLLPLKKETLLGDRGTRLSGGQAQRMTIARAYLQQSPILLFDEATSALDNESEKIVQSALEKAASGRTVLAVAHRLSTIIDYDNIIVMKEGHKIEEGRHSSLVSSNGEYRKLYELSASP